MMMSNDGSHVSAVKPNGTSPARDYVVLERQEFEDAPHEPFFVEVHRVEARNAENALRQAFKEMRAAGYTALVATLVVVPVTQWRPTDVHANVRESVSVGAPGT
jgi:hypothetical protein